MAKTRFFPKSLLRQLSDHIEEAGGAPDFVEVDRATLNQIKQAIIAEDPDHFLKMPEDAPFGVYFQGVRIVAGPPRQSPC